MDDRLTPAAAFIREETNMYDQAEAASYTSEAPDRRATHVESELQRMPEHLHMLHEALGELEKRLSGVLRPCEDNAKAGGEPREALVPVAELLSNSNFSIRGAHHAVVSILDRLEL